MTKYFRYTLKGKHTQAEANTALGPLATHGMVVRIDANGGETHVVIAADTPPHAAHKLPTHVQAAGEIPEAEVLRAP